MASTLKLYARLLGLFVVLVGFVSFNIIVWGLHRHPSSPVLYVPGGNRERGQVLIQRYSCYSCHAIPGIRRAKSNVGPRLDRMREQIYIAGVLPNNPQNLTDWIVNPKASDPQTAMPDLGVNEQDARDIAAYLYDLESD